MKATDAVKFMQTTGKCVKSAGSNYFYKLFRNDVICQLLPAGTCCATVMLQVSPDEFESQGYRMEFEEYATG